MKALVLFLSILSLHSVSQASFLICNPAENEFRIHSAQVKLVDEVVCRTGVQITGEDFVICTSLKSSAQKNWQGEIHYQMCVGFQEGSFVITRMQDARLR